MCGIFFSLIKASHSQNDVDQISLDFNLLKKRGPDYFDLKTIQVNVGDQVLGLLFGASVLSLRGSKLNQVTKQPLTDAFGNVLLWNGEIFSSNLVKVNDGENDGKKLMDCLAKTKGNESDLLKIFESIQGPYAFVYFEKESNNIYFGRDRLGRRSLLISLNRSDDSNYIFNLSSVKTKCNSYELSEYEELKANGIFKINLTRISEVKNLNFDFYEWKKVNEKSEVVFYSSKQKMLENYYSQYIKPSNTYLIDSISCFNDNILDDFSNQNDKELESLVDRFFDQLKDSVMRRVKNIPNFCKECSQKHSHLKFNDEFKGFKCSHAKLAVLFSGGVDSTVLAAMADLCIPADEPIDLLNIAFEKQTTSNSNSKHTKSHKRNKKSKMEEDEEEIENDLEGLSLESQEFLVPDRISGFKSLKELNPKRVWNFVEINITLDELKLERENLIKHLVYPHQTVLDDSIGCALWFASRGQGLVNGKPFKSNAEVLLLGMGADEQLAGYVRHRTRYEKDGLASLCNELKMEMKRISERNLGRDDRIISDHGKESRLPFLDENVISFLNELSVSQKCNMKLAKGWGEKYLLRTLASSRLGLNFAAALPKRAIQFGSRIAKIENNKESASDICSRIAN